MKELREEEQIAGFSVESKIVEAKEFARDILLSEKAFRFGF
jgi:hypothetical protein